MANDLELQAYGGLLDLCPEAEDSGPPDKRRHARVSFSPKVLLVELDDSACPGASAPGEGVDLSRSGIGVRSRRMYYTGRRVLIKVMVPNQNPRVKCGVVRFTRYAASGFYHIGIEFCIIPESAAITQWLNVNQHA